VFLNIFYSLRDAGLSIGTECAELSLILKEDPETRVFIIGHASMAPSELYSRYGNIN
jgi:hypothetical protein